MINKLFPVALLLISHASSLDAQIVTVLPGTDLSIAGGTSFSADSFIITPASVFTLNGVTLSKASTEVHTLSDTHITKVYEFSGITGPFTGSLDIYYDDAELNGLGESTLGARVYDGTTWQSPSTANRDTVINDVQTVSISGMPLEEVTLGEPPGSLPLLWGGVYATRGTGNVTVSWSTLQEDNVSFFSVEKSTDARSWSVLGDRVMATDGSTAHYYSVADPAAGPLKTYYRIRQTDRDARTSYSPVAILAALPEATGTSIYPNPVRQSFRLSITGGSPLQRILLYSNDGSVVRTWDRLQNSFNVEDLPAGVYHLRIFFVTGEARILQLNKQ